MARAYKEDPHAVEHITALCGKTLDELLEDIAADARRFVPVATGRLKSKVGHDKTSPTRGRVFANTEYAAAVERGHMTRGGTQVPAQPYLRPAAFKHRGGSR